MSDSTTPQDDKAMSLASAGSQPVAWEIRRSDGALEALTPCVRMSEQILRCIGGGTILPLYRHPQPTLTDEERGAIALAKSRLGTSDGDWQADDVLAALLERLC
jgi:hypothetical protein